MEPLPVPAGHVRLTWTTVATEEYELTRPLATLTANGIEPDALTPAEVKPGSALDIWLGDQEGTEDGTDGVCLCTGERQLTDVGWPPGEEPDRQQSQPDAGRVASSDSEPDPGRIDLTRRFTVDQSRARDWLNAAVTAYEADLDPVPELVPTGREQLPEITGNWKPGAVGEEETLSQLVTLAGQAGIITSPAGMELEFRQSDDTYGAYYWFQLGVGPEVEMASPVRDLHTLCDSSLTGTGAALSILHQAVAAANEILDGLTRLTGTAAGPARPA
jgi:hypothetical protein